MSKALYYKGTYEDVRGYLYKPKKSKYWHTKYHYFDANGKKIPGAEHGESTKMTIKSDAIRFMMERVDSLKQKTIRLTPAMPFVDFIRYWLEKEIIKDVEATTYSGYVLNVNNHIIPYFKGFDYRIKDLSPKKFKISWMKNLCADA